MSKKKVLLQTASSYESKRLVRWDLLDFVETFVKNNGGNVQIENYELMFCGYQVLCCCEGFRRQLVDQPLSVLQQIYTIILEKEIQEIEV